MINWFDCNRRLVLERPDSLPARVVRDGDRHLRDVVFVIGFRQLMADARAEGVRESARLIPLRDEPGIDRDPDNVVAGRDRRLPITAVEQEVLPAESPVVYV